MLCLSVWGAMLVSISRNSCIMHNLYEHGLLRLWGLGFVFFIFSVGCGQPNYDYNNMCRESLGRGVVAVPYMNGDSVFVSWRLLREDNDKTGFNVYKNGRRLNKKVIYNVTYFKDANVGGRRSVYEVRTVDNGRECHRKDGTFIFNFNDDVHDGYFNDHDGYLCIPLQLPAGGITPDGVHFSYSANDCSVGDVDGDGEYEYFVKWDPSNSKDNAHSGFTGNVLIDCYKLSGERLWRIDLGRNIRAGAHYTQMMVYDLDGDGVSEVVMKTADGSVDGKGHVIGDANADYRDSGGKIMRGAEYLSVFSGLTGEVLYSTDYIPQRGNVGDWGDNNANRCDRFLACVAYLDGKIPCVVMCRGYYTRTVLVAWSWDGMSLNRQWIFDSDSQVGHNGAGQGNHNIRVADVDGDGCDEILYGAMCVDNDGSILYNTRLGHGDAMHLYAFMPDSPKLQLWDVHEGHPCSELHDAATGEIIFSLPASKDVGRGMAADIDPTSPGLELWSSASGGIRNAKGELINHQGRLSTNFAVWWDGDKLRELLDGAQITKFDWTNGSNNVIFDMTGECVFNNGTKSNPCLSADVFGDWREEVVVRTKDSRELRIYTTTCSTPYRFVTFMQDIPYRLSVVTENVAYNQPPEPGFYFGE